MDSVFILSRPRNNASITFVDRVILLGWGYKVTISNIHFRRVCFSIETPNLQNTINPFCSRLFLFCQLIRKTQLKESSIISGTIIATLLICGDLLSKDLMALYLWVLFLNYLIREATLEDQKHRNERVLPTG